MPTLIASHFALDVSTLFAVTLFVTVIGGLLLLFAFLQNRQTPALALWGVGYLVGATGAALLSGQAIVVSNAWAVATANALLCIAYGLMWSGARSFEGRRVSVVGLAVGPALWLCAFQSAFFAHSVAARISLVAAISAAYALLAARELWYARDRDLLSRWRSSSVAIPCSSAPWPSASRRRCCCSIWTASRRSTTPLATRRAIGYCALSAIWSARRSGRATCSAGLAVRSSPI